MLLADQLPTDGKTKSIMSFIPKELTGKRLLIILAEPTAVVTRAGRNIPTVVVRQASQLTVKEVLAAEVLVVTQQSLDVLTTRITSGATA